MIESFSNYAFSIICSSFLLNIIQMILPNSNNKKYILFVCSSIVTIILITPIISMLNKDFDVSKLLLENQKDYIEVDEQQIESLYEQELINTYKENLNNDIIQTLNEAGYEVLNIDCEYDKDTLEPNFLKVEIKSDTRKSSRS